MVMDRKTILLLSLAFAGCGEPSKLRALRGVHGALEAGQNNALHVVGDHRAGLGQAEDPIPVDLYGISHGISRRSSTWVAVGCDGETGVTFRNQVPQPEGQEEAWQHVNTGGSPCLRAVTWSNGFVAVGDGGTILESSDGRLWSTVSRKTEANLHGVFAGANTDVFAVGDGGVILHRGGTVWSEIQGPVTTDLYAVYARSNVEAYAVGAGGTILWYSGSSWSEMTSGIDSDLRSVHGTYWPSYQISKDPTVFAVGDGGTILRLTGGSWEEMSSNTDQDLFGVWGFDEEDHFQNHPAIYVVGANATVLEFVFHD